MKQFNWNADKNQLLMAERGVSLEDVLYAFQAGQLLDEVAHPNTEKYPQQRVFIVCIDDYAWLVPFVETTDEIFLKSIIPSRKATKQYLRRAK
ncbi:BrnT family toxin [Alkalimonas delamerensis]|uniref:BrnT family toxin n=1 Tax=Alkalimonas delamerensis TaxID=265981 RepID=A0ABT9GLE9_9GAMM|nr:BrnT family toxin [Alkalimonas delamerensis]MDP4527797.1 BrnT family toxin [Alkalimonas delamerensis]